jgi:predicted Rossmann fold flavoprotein
VNSTNNPDVVIIGAGASGLMCAATAGYRGRNVWVLEHTHKIGRKILMSGGGRCNFTNVHNGPDNFISGNAHFCKSALSRYRVQDFIELVERHGVEYHEKTLGQLFCNEKSTEILRVLLTEAEWAGVSIKTEVKVESITANSEGGFTLKTTLGEIHPETVVIATGGLSIPNGGATPFAYEVAKQFGLAVTPTTAALVPVTLQKELLDKLNPLSGVSHPVVVSCNGTSFKESMLFTHRGLSGPAILQISSYWTPGDAITIDFFPEESLLDYLKAQREERPKADIVTVLSSKMSKRMAQIFAELYTISGNMADQSNAKLEQVADTFHAWSVKPSGTEGYRTAEVTLGGIDTNGISQKTMEAKTQQGLYFIGECLDVTGHLGGHNFQWAWASGFAAGQVV